MKYLELDLNLTADAKAREKPKAVVYQRSVSRAIVNVQQIIDLGNHYDLDISVLHNFNDGDTLRFQGERIMNTSVMIMAHGADEANDIFISSHGAVIEIFPYGMKNQIFERQAREIGKTSNSLFQIFLVLNTYL